MVVRQSGAVLLSITDCSRRSLMKSIPIVLLIANAFLCPSTLYGDSWERRALFPPGQCPPMYIEKLGETTMAIDAAGRIIEYHADSVHIVGFPYQESSVQRVVPTRNGLFVLYYDGVVYKSPSLSGVFDRLASNIIDISSDRNGYGYMLLEGAAVRDMNSGIVTQLPLTRLRSITAFGDNIVVVDSARIASHLALQRESDTWRLLRTLEIEDATHATVPEFLNADTIIYIGYQGMKSCDVTTGSFAQYRLPNSILQDTGSSIDAQLFVDSSGITIVREFLEYSEFGVAKRRHLAVHYYDSSREWTKRVLNSAVLGFPFYTHYAQELGGHIWLALSNGALFTLRANEVDQVVQSSRNTAGWSQVAVRGDTTVFIASTSKDGTSGFVPGYYIALYSISKDMWLGSFEVSLPSEWPSNVPVILFDDSPSKMHIVVVAYAATIDLAERKLDTAGKLPVKFSITHAAYVKGRIILALSNCSVMELDTNWKVVRVDSVTSGSCIGLKATISASGSVAFRTPSSGKSRIVVFHADTRGWLTIEEGDDFATYAPIMMDNGNVMIPRLIAYNVANDSYTYSAQIYDEGGLLVANVAEETGPIATYARTNYASKDLFAIEERRPAILIFSATDKLIHYSSMPRRWKRPRAGYSDFV